MYEDLGVPLALDFARARVGSPSGLGLRPRAATTLWPTGPGPGGIPLWRDLQSPLTRGNRNLFCQFIYWVNRIRLKSTVNCQLSTCSRLFLLNSSTSKPLNYSSWVPPQQCMVLQLLCQGGHPGGGSGEPARGGNVKNLCVPGRSEGETSPNQSNVSLDSSYLFQFKQKHRIYFIHQWIRQSPRETRSP